MFVECTYTRPMRSEANPAHIESIVVVRYIWKQMNVAKKTISVVSTWKTISVVRLSMVNCVSYHTIDWLIV